MLYIENCILKCEQKRTSFNKLHIFFLEQCCSCLCVSMDFNILKFGIKKNYVYEKSGAVKTAAVAAAATRLTNPYNSVTKV